MIFVTEVTLDHKVPGSNPTGGRIQLMTAQHFIAPYHPSILMICLNPCHAE